MLMCYMHNFNELDTMVMYRINMFIKPKHTVLCKQVKPRIVEKNMYNVNDLDT